MKTLLLAAGLLAPVQSIDLAVRDAIQSVRTPWLTPVMRGATDVGKPVHVLGALLVLVTLSPVAGVSVTRLALVTLIPVNIVVEGLKRLTQRARPDGGRNPHNSSFPSSHVANGFALAAVLARRWKRHAVWLFSLASLVAFSRMYLDRHYLSDVVVGAALGLLGAWSMARWLAAKLEVASPGDRALSHEDDRERAMRVESAGGL